MRSAATAQFEDRRAAWAARVAGGASAGSPYKPARAANALRLATNELTWAALCQHPVAREFADAHAAGLDAGP